MQKVGDVSLKVECEKKERKKERYGGVMQRFIELPGNHQMWQVLKHHGGTQRLVVVQKALCTQDCWDFMNVGERMKYIAT
jgi:hypothetical protein